MRISYDGISALNIYLSLTDIRCVNAICMNCSIFSYWNTVCTHHRYAGNIVHTATTGVTIRAKSDSESGAESKLITVQCFAQPPLCVHRSMWFMVCVWNAKCINKAWENTWILSLPIALYVCVCVRERETETETERKTESQRVDKST